MMSLKLTDTLNSLNREMADLETQMISAERLKQYSDDQYVPQEGALRAPDFQARLANWPSNGSVEFQDVKVRYRDELPLVGVQSDGVDGSCALVVSLATTSSVEQSQRGWRLPRVPRENLASNRLAIWATFGCSTTIFLNFFKKRFHST